MASNQAYLFLIFTLNGMIIGLLFDVFRILRKSFNTNDLLTYIEDIIFWFLTGIIILFSMCKFSDGELRGYTIIGIAIGVTIYMITISTYFIKVSVFIVNIIKNIVGKIFGIVTYPVKIILKPFIIIRQNISKNLNKILKGIKIPKKVKKLVKKEGNL